jgi:sulfur-oxidizing protein SoxB
MDYALTAEAYPALAQAYGPMSGLAHVATILDSIRKDRPGALLVMGGETVMGSYLSDVAGPQAVWDVIASLGPDAVSTTGDVSLPFALPEASGTPSVRRFDRDGLRIALIGHVPLPKGENALRECVAQARRAGARAVIWMSGNGIAADRGIAATPGIDLILSSGHHDALPEPIEVGATRIIASGGQGRFVSRLDLEVTDSGVEGVRQILIPVFAELIAPEPEMVRRIAQVRAPYEEDMTRDIGRAEGLLFRRGLYESSWDDLLCAALQAHQGAQIALVPGYRWGRTVLLGRAVTLEDLHTLTSGGPGGTRVVEMNGAALRDRLEDAAEAVFGDRSQGGPRMDMLRAGGLFYRIAPDAAWGARISGLALHPSGALLEPDKIYSVALWEGDAGPGMVDLLKTYTSAQGTVGGTTVSRVEVI